MTWIEFVSQVGIPAAILVALGLFFWKALWPFLVHQLEGLQEATRLERIEYLKMIGARDTAFQEALERRDVQFKIVVDALEELSEANERLTDQMNSLAETSTKLTAQVEATVIDLRGRPCFVLSRGDVEGILENKKN